MKQGISYSFLLNIVILFVFVCGAIISGIFSYHRAFKANTIIINEIEKYEGYNCLSKDSIEKKLNSMGYNVPFNVRCRTRKGEPCITDDEEHGNYAVVSYNLDGAVFSADDDIKYIYNISSDEFRTMNSRIFYDASSSSYKYTSEYQYGVYTYMYSDLPVVSSFLKIPFFSKTQKLYEYRDIRILNTSSDGIIAYDYGYVPQDIIDDASILESDYMDVYGNRILNNFVNGDVMGSNYYYGLLHGEGSYFHEYSSKELFKYYSTAVAAQELIVNGKHNCGFTVDWSAY